MSEKNVELVRRFYDTAAKGRMTEMRRAFAADFKLREERSMRERETLYGAEAAAETARMASQWTTAAGRLLSPRGPR
jgi:ketosteroid isomerase-like protein